eukprot:CAMPEP_0114480782 /NCGR_PEP_ID=MMETSP0104-20121206/17318_1 /TAXON_ID=37642 ORGANISM="Paraphysomonas imperforata, Strain PA2" /NCGR_SAMPLE_ID=MMETSP0104 /ASSEMBLY_ACC=CAM_ASM_000202 /LENGTH=164 /DNA_ID=CAMNT_0001656295 /DNA_START=93 /DNA_END=587 /DNA_ORIENTATION=-
MIAPVLSLNSTMNTFPTVDASATGLAGATFTKRHLRTVPLPTSRTPLFNALESWAQENPEGVSDNESVAGAPVTGLVEVQLHQDEDGTTPDVEDTTVKKELEVDHLEMSFRERAIARWKDKRSRRTFRKKVVCKARGDVAKVRPRVGGRFVKSQSIGWVSITSL